MPRIYGGRPSRTTVKVDVMVTEDVKFNHNDCAGCGEWTPDPDTEQAAEFVRSKYLGRNIPPTGCNMLPGFNWVPPGWRTFRMGDVSPEPRVLCPECSQAVDQALSARRRSGAP
jgi:hypothetical protein